MRSSLTSLNVNDIFQAVDAGDFALASLVASTSDDNFVVLSDGNGADVVLFSQLFAQWCAHDDAAHTRGSTVMRLSRLASRGVEAGVDLRHLGGIVELLDGGLSTVGCSQSRNRDGKFLRN